MLTATVGSPVTSQATTKVSSVPTKRQLKAFNNSTRSLPTVR